MQEQQYRGVFRTGHAAEDPDSVNVGESVSNPEDVHATCLLSQFMH
jgi:hypothetical protein